MKLPSVQRLFGELLKVLKQFPLESLFALIACAAGTYYVKTDYADHVSQSLCWRIITASNIGLLLSLSASLFASARNMSLLTKLILYLPALLISFLLFLVFDPLNKEGDIVRFILVSFGFHLLVSFAAFIGWRESNINGFWQFNKSLFLRFLAGVLYSAVLYAGLAAAIASLNFLFHLKIDSDIYGIVWVWIAGMFQTLFFLAGIPLNWSELNEEDSYPRGLKLFTQYVLIPLATVYVVILLAYEAKILVQWRMPEGLVSSLILGYSVFGMLAILLVFPLRKLDGNKWINSFSRYFYFLLLPLLVLLFLAIFARIRNYGITEERYFVLALALWLSFITLYFLTSKRQNIMLIPVSLCIVTLVADFGPLNAFNVSRNSQVRELKKLFEKAGAVKDGKIVPLSSNRDSVTTERIIDVSRYLLNKYGLKSLQPLTGTDLNSVTDSIKTALKIKKEATSYRRYQVQEAERNWLSSHYNIPEYYRIDINTHTLRAENRSLVPLEGMDYAVDVDYYRTADDTINFPSNNKLFLSGRPSEFQIKLNNDSIRFKASELLPELEALVKKEGKAAEGDIEAVLPRSVFRREFRLGSHQIKLLFNSVSYTLEGEEREFSDVQATVLLK